MMKLLSLIPVLTVYTALVPSWSRSEDFRCYRGPLSSGVADPGPGLADAWPEGGPPVIAVLDECRPCVCVDPRNGSVLWDLALDQGETRIPSDTRLCQATPTVGDGYLILQRSERRGTLAFRVFTDDPDRMPELAWVNQELWRNNAPLIHQDYVYCGYTRRDRVHAWCFDLHTGELQSNVTESDSPLEGGFKNYGDPILADGKIFAVVNKKVFLFRPDPAGIHYVGQTSPIDAADTSAPAIADGRLCVLCYSRGGTARVTCLDIAPPSDAKPAITQAHLPDGVVGPCPAAPGPSEQDGVRVR